MRFLWLFLLAFPMAFSAQSDCEFSVNVADSIGTYQATRDVIVYERVFGGTSRYLFFSLEKTNGVPSLQMKMITKSRDFIKANCLDENSRMFLQLNNGQVVTLLYSGQDDCGVSVRDPEGVSSRIQSGNFWFAKAGFDALLTSEVNLVRIRFGTETIDLPIRTSLKAELDGQTYAPSRYFIDYLHCITTP